jgi:hypothetical protein
LTDHPSEYEEIYGEKKIAIVQPTMDSFLRKPKI